MNEKTSEQYEELTDYFAQTVHKFVDQLRERAAGMEKVAGGGATAAFSDRAMENIDREVNKLQAFVGENPTRAALMAFGAGAVASRIFKGMGANMTLESVQVEPVPEKPKKVAKKAPVKKAAAKKPAVKKPAVKKPAVKKPTLKKAPVKKAA